MSIKEHLNSLREDFATKTEQYIHAERTLLEEGNGFFDKKLLEDLSQAATDWRKASDAYHSFLSQIASQKLNINAEMDH